MSPNTLFREFDSRDWQTATDGTVRYALVGLGWWTTDVAVPAIEESTFCETTVLVSGSAEKATRLADESDVERGITYEQYHEGVAADEYDAVYVATPNAYHLDYVETAFDHYDREDVLAAYVAAWLRKVERVGNNNYPEEARQRGIHGAVRVEAVLRPDGSLAGVRVLESSGEEVLDEAARRVIRLGAPYSQLGPELSRRMDRLHIPHRFVFTEGGPLRAAP